MPVSGLLLFDYALTAENKRDLLDDEVPPPEPASPKVPFSNPSDPHPPRRGASKYRMLFVVLEAPTPQRNECFRLLNSNSV